MSRYLLDTNHWTHYEVGRECLLLRLEAEAEDAAAVSVVTVAEAIRGRIMQAFGTRAEESRKRIDAYRKLNRTVSALSAFHIVPYTEECERVFQELRRKCRAKPHDLCIAATAIVRGLVVLTEDFKDFDRIRKVSSLRIEDWSQ